MDERRHGSDDGGQDGFAGGYELQLMERGEAHCPPSPSLGHVAYRRLKPSDLSSLQRAHRRMFPIDYEDAFYQRAVLSQDGIVSWVAVARGGGMEEEVEEEVEEDLVGFITARLSRLQESDLVDRTLLQMDSPSVDGNVAMYILTIGVAEEYRQLGIATTLLQIMTERAMEQACIIVYLHVITYNHSAIAFYQRNGFNEVALLRNFYFIATGRQPNPSQVQYDAYLYAKVLERQLPKHSWSYCLLNCAVSPMRHPSPSADPRAAGTGAGKGCMLPSWEGALLT
eukprot:jgi/Botrbrau1/19420/Bobra.0338s0047.1